MGDDARYLVLGPTADMVRDILVPFFTNCYADTDLAGDLAIQAAIYSLPTGGKIYFRSADHPLRIEGHQFSAACVDEPSQMKALIWPVIQARTALHRAPVLFTGYPTNMGWYFHEIYQVWKRGDQDFNVLQFASTENPLYPKDEFEKARQRLPDWLFRMRYLGQFTKPAGLVYPMFGVERMFVEPFKIPDDWPVFVGLDPSVFYGALFMTWHDGIWYVFAEYYNEYLTGAEDHARAIKQRLQGSVVGYIYDPARLTDVNELRKYGIGPLAKASNAVLAGITTVTGIMNDGRLKVFRGSCPNFVDQMERYAFPTDPLTGDKKGENPIKKDDHLPDCVRYILHTLETAEPVEPEQVVTYDASEQISRY